MLFSEDFDAAGLPSAWTQTTSISTAVWDHSQAEGVAGSGVARAFVSGYFTAQSVWLETPVMDLSGTTDLQMNFQTAMANRGSEDTMLEVSYDTGSGWTPITTFGQSSSAANLVAVTIIQEHDTWSPATTDYVPVTLTDLHNLPGLGNIRFGFGSNTDNSDNSYVFVDSLVIHDL